MLIVTIYFGLRMSEDEIFQFYKMSRLFQTSVLFHENIFFAINSIFRLPKDCFSKYHLLNFARSALRLIIL